MDNKFQNFLVYLLGIIVLIFWEMLTKFFHISNLILPSPSTIFLNLINGIENGFYLPHLIQTFMEVFWGLMIGLILGLGGGILLGEIPIIRKIFLPYVLISQIVPKLALAPLFIMWFGFGPWPCIIMTGLICFFPMLETTITAIDNTDLKKVRLFKILGANRFQILFHLKFISGLPYILSGFRVSVVLALVGAVVSEFIGASKGLGSLFFVGQSSMNTPMIFASIVLISVMGICIYSVVVFFETLLLKNFPTVHRAI